MRSRANLTRDIFMPSKPREFRISIAPTYFGFQFHGFFAAVLWKPTNLAVKKRHHVTKPTWKTLEIRLFFLSKKLPLGRKVGPEITNLDLHKSGRKSHIHHPKPIILVVINKDQSVWNHPDKTKLNRYTPED